MSQQGQLSVTANEAASCGELGAPRPACGGATSFARAESSDCIDRCNPGEGVQVSPRTLPVRLPLVCARPRFVRWKRLSAVAGGHRPRRVAMSPVPPPATTVGELWDLRHVTHDRTVA